MDRWVKTCGGWFNLAYVVRFDVNAYHGLDEGPTLYGVTAYLADGVGQEWEYVHLGYDTLIEAKEALSTLMDRINTEEGRLITL